MSKTQLPGKQYCKACQVETEVLVRPTFAFEVNMGQDEVTPSYRFGTVVCTGCNKPYRGLDSDTYDRYVASAFQKVSRYTYGARRKK